MEERMYDIESIIKHRKPMRLIDELLSFDAKSASVLVSITEQSEFYRAEYGGVPSYIGIEYMAQCIAAKAGANDLFHHKEVSLGFLLGTRKYQPLVTEFVLGQTLKVSVTEITDEEGGLSVFSGQIVDINKPAVILAEAKINVFRPKDSASYLKG